MMFRNRTVAIRNPRNWMPAAYSTKVKGEAEAEAIRARGAALRDNPDMIKLIQAERWNGILPTTMVPGAALPFVNVTH